MKEYKIKNLRNVGIIGHSGTGKTSLAEALLFYTKSIDRLGKVEDGTTTTDFDAEEKKKQISLQAAVAPFAYKDIKINLVDVPGYFDFVGEQIQGMRAVDVATIVVSAASGIEVGTDKAWDYCNKIKLPRTFFINKMDRDHTDYDKVFAQLKEKYGMSVIPIQYPVGKEENFRGVINIISNRARIHDPKTFEMKEAPVPEDLVDKVAELREMIVESVAQTDEVLMEKYFGGEEITMQEIYDALIKGCASGDIAPVMCGSATKAIGMSTLLEDIVECFPTPEHAIPQKALMMDTGETEYIPLSEEGPFSGFVFKTVADPFVGKISLFRVITGFIKPDTVVLNTNQEKTEKISTLIFLRGKNQTLTDKIIAGDIGAVTKLQYTRTGETISDPKFRVIYDKFNFPTPTMTMSVVPKAKGDEDKISSGLQRLVEEDPTFTMERDKETAEILVSGQGDTHLEILASRLKSKFGVDVELRKPRIPYRETIKKKSDVQGKHKKQSGGHGQYGDVKIIFEPRPDGVDEMLFVDKVVGGAVPRNFIPAVEKGLRESIKEGIVAGYPVIKLQATLYDGSFHAVDSSEMAFKVAANLAFKKGMELASPTLLEPIIKVSVTVPDEYMGDIMGDINKKRGRVLGMEPVDGKQMVVAEVPLSEMQTYATDLRSMTQARGEFTMEFSRYEEVPASEIPKIVEETKKFKESKE
ncbi:elongation factor G [Proteiniclasticum sp. BAD-10]|uniref:Elongation factor G n=1 Tax=Proteiniclasticum sediminis TaxID=2804028 RepID=A0A941HR86_9CLOT|nr:elongation factor G [Proteiniclasticum sediminis]